MVKWLKKSIKYALLGLFSPILVFAAGTVIPSPISGLPGTEGTTATQLLSKIIENVLLPVAGLIAVGFLIYGGFQYVTSRGEEEQAESGKKTIQNSIIGLVIIILSYVIVTVIANALIPGGSGV